MFYQLSLYFKKHLLIDFLQSSLFGIYVRLNGIIFIQFANLRNRYNSTNMKDTCKNCAKCGKGFKIGTNEAYNYIKTKIRAEDISKIFCFCSYANMAAKDKRISLKRKFFKKIFTP